MPKWNGTPVVQGYNFRQRAYEGERERRKKGRHGGGKERRGSGYSATSRDNQGQRDTSNAQRNAGVRSRGPEDPRSGGVSYPPVRRGSLGHDVSGRNFPGSVENASCITEYTTCTIVRVDNSGMLQFKSKDGFWGYCFLRYDKQGLFEKFLGKPFFDLEGTLVSVPKGVESVDINMIMNKAGVVFSDFCAR